MATTGYSDTFGRTVAGGLGTATSGQAYTTVGTAGDFSVAPNTASIAPSTGSSDYAGTVDLLASDVDLSGLVAFSALPGSNTTHGGFVLKYADSSNYYVAKIVVTPAGAITLRFDKRVAGVGSTVATATVAGTLVAGTFYNLRAAARWSQVLQTNVLQAKFWAVGSTEPGGWTATALDASLTAYTAGSRTGLFARNEAAVLGAIVRFQSVASRTHALPYPAGVDPVCYDPAYTYPRQTAVQSLAAAVDSAVASYSTDAAAAALYPRVRVSASLYSIDSSLTNITFPFTTTEFNIGTNTDLSLDSQQLYLPQGIWLVTGEVRIAEAATDLLQLTLGGTNSISIHTDTQFRSNPTQLNNEGVGGTGRVFKLVISANPVSPATCFLTVSPSSATAVYTATYAALTAVKISDYFT